jgi:hypothetical protein
MITSRPIGKGAVLMNGTNGDCYELNAVGARVWNGIEKGEPVSRIVDTIAAEYGVVAEVVRRDVESLVDQLARAGAVIISR